MVVQCCPAMNNFNDHLKQGLKLIAGSNPKCARIVPVTKKKQPGHSFKPQPKGVFWGI